MKIVFKEWLKDPKTCCLLMLYAVISIIHAAVDTVMIAMISSVFDQYTTERMINVVIVSVLAIILSIITGYMNPYIRNRAFTTMELRWTNIILNADYDLFVTKTEASIQHTSEMMWRIISLGMSLVNILSRIIEIIILLVSIYNIGYGYINNHWYICSVCDYNEIHL